MQTSDQTSTAPMPEFVRYKQAVELFGIGIGTLKKMVRRKLIKSHLLRVDGNVSGTRLLSTSSIREAISKSPAA